MRNPAPIVRGAILGAALALIAPSAQAAPIAATPLLDKGAPTEVVLVRGGCGFGEHRGPYGGCRINNGPRGALRAATTGLPRGCPPGMHRGFYGRCRY